MIDEATLALIFQTKEARKASKGAVAKKRVYLRSEPGTLVRERIKKMGDYDFGTHVGNVGTTKRSSKGRTYKLPNGSRRYLGYDYDHGKPAVVAYKV